MDFFTGPSSGAQAINDGFDDRPRILTGSVDKTAKLWDAALGKLLASFEHEGAVSRVAFSPDGARILTVSLDKTAKLWDTVSGKLLASLDHPYPVFVSKS